MASRKEQKERLRREREARERAAAEGARRRRLIGYGVGGALALAAVIAIAVVAIAGAGGGSSGDGTGPRAEANYPTVPIPPQREADLAKAARAAGCTVRSYPDEGRGHTQQQVRYRTNPPTSGRHNPVPADDGVYGESPGEEHLVHSLEHGRVILQFRPSVPERVKGQLKSLFDEDPYHVLLTPNPAMPFPVAATAWTESITCREVNDRTFDALRAFKQQNRDRAPEFVP